MTQILTVDAYSIQRHRRPFWLQEQQKTQSPEREQSTLYMSAVLDQAVGESPPTNRDSAQQRLA